MSDQRSIGIFDSGLGGLTVAKEIYKILPHESTVYIGDTARVPYGNRSPETIIKFSLQLTQKLIEYNVKAIVVACATASSTAIKTLKQNFPHIPIMGVIEPATVAAINVSNSDTIGIIGTRATINSRSFETISKKIKPNLIFQSQACPLFVPIIEEGIIENNPILADTISHYLSIFTPSSIDTLILGCTHYPLIKKDIQSFLPQVNLINVGTSLAHSLKLLLETTNLQTDSTDLPKHQYYATDINDNFIAISQLLLNQKIKIHKITL